MSFISLPTGKLHKKTETRKLKNFPAGYVGKFYRNLANKVNNAVFSECYGRIANDANIPSNDVQKYLLATSDFAKVMQDDINHYVTRDRLNNASFRQGLDLISKNILRCQSPLELLFEDISTFDAQNSVVGSLLRELEIRQKDVASELIKKAPTPGIDLSLQKRLKTLQNDNIGFNKNNSNNNGRLPPPPPSPPSFNNRHRNFLFHHCLHLIHFNKHSIFDHHRLHCPHLLYHHCCCQNQDCDHQQLKLNYQHTLEK